ncbi:MAG: type I methionyl aminopeptidase [Christensenellales bacterium]|jgi:methionyl aminopeptidase
MIIFKSEYEIELMRKAGAVAAEVLQRLGEKIEAGMTTADLDALAEDLIRKKGGRASFKGYNGFPASICTSVNQEVVHGIPGKRVLRQKDIVSIDVGVEMNGYHGDTAWTFCVGEVEENVARLLQTTQQCLQDGIAMARANNRLGDVGSAIQKRAESAGFSVVRELIGHGIGQNLHEDPNVPNYGKPGRGVKLRPGMTLAIEPMINLGAADVVVLSDEWTVVAKDGKPSAHFEHTIAVLEDGCRILTAL